MNYTAPCIMFWMCAYPLRGEVGGGWALEFPSFLGPVKWERADRRVPFGAQKTREFQLLYQNLWIFLLCVSFCSSKDLRQCLAYKVISFYCV
jgi:hypothetical protein